MKPKHLNPGEKVAIVSLSSGILGESFIKHELDLAVKRLNEYGLEPVFMQNSLKGLEYIAAHPEKRAEDLKAAFLDKEIKGIICAIGGDDTYKLAPYLMEDKEFITAVNNNPKIFTGFSDTTINHLMLNRLGLNTYYGPTVVCDLAELDREMLPYTKMWFETFLGKKQMAITSSDTWYKERSDFSPASLNTPRESVIETKGYETLQGSGVRSGKLFGGCIESLYQLVFDEEKSAINQKYKLFPTADELKGKILFLETSELKISPEHLNKILKAFRELGIFDTVNGLIIGKPQDAAFYEEYKVIYREVLGDIDLPILYNVNFGHALPRCVVPYNIKCRVDYDNRTIEFLEDMFS